MRLVRAAPSNFKPFALKRPRWTAAAVAAARFSGVSSSSAIWPIAVALLQGSGAQGLLDFASLGERHEDAGHAGLQPVDRGVVAALADGGGAARQHRAIVRAQRLGKGRSAVRHVVQPGADGGRIAASDEQPPAVAADPGSFDRRLEQLAPDRTAACGDDDLACAFLFRPGPRPASEGR